MPICLIKFYLSDCFCSFLILYVKIFFVVFRSEASLVISEHLKGHNESNIRTSDHHRWSHQQPRIPSSRCWKAFPSFLRSTLSIRDERSEPPPLWRLEMFSWEEEPNGEAQVVVVAAFRSTRCTNTELAALVGRDRRRSVIMLCMPIFSH